MQFSLSFAIYMTMTCWLTVDLVTADNIFWFTSMLIQNEPQNSGHGTGRSGLNLQNLLRRCDFPLKHRAK